MNPLYALSSMLSSDFTSHFRFVIITILYRSHPVLSLVFYSTNLLLLSYHTMSSSCLISLTIYLPASVCPSSRHGFQCMFMIRIYRYTCAYLRTSLGISITTCWRVLTPLDPHVQVLELGAYGFFQLLT